MTREEALTRREEILKEINRLEDREWDIQMCDHWSADDYENIRKIRNEISKLKTELSEL